MLKSSPISMRWLAALFVTCLAAASPLLGHGPGGGAPVGEAYDSVWRAWTFPPLVTSTLLIACLVYGTGVARLWRRVGGGSGISRRQTFAFAVGMGVLALALVSPIDALSDELGWMHMIQHMLIMNVSAPILVLGMPGMAYLWALPLAQRRWIGGWKRRGTAGRVGHYLLWQPLLLWALFAFTLWIWHLPVLYEGALHNDLFHDLQHFTFLVSACLFWRVLLDPVSRLRMSRAVAVFYLFLTSLHATFLGVFMALAPSVWYPTYVGRTDAWNVSALQDQQLAGLIMWMPACMAYAIVAAVMLALWLEKESRPDVSKNEPTVREPA